MLISLALGLVMLGVGMSMSLSDFKVVFRHPQAFLLGLFLQIVLVPVLSFGVAALSGLPAVWQVGFVVLALCPGGTTSGFICYLFRANVALSISLTAINSFITLFTIPLVTNYALQAFMEQDTFIRLPFWLTVAQIFLITLVPAFLGIWVKHRFPLFVEKSQQTLKFLTVFLLGLIFGVKMFGGEESALSWAISLSLLPITIFLNLLGMVLGYYSAVLFRFKPQDGFTIGVELAIHNTSLAFLVGSTLLKNDLFIQPALVYSVFSFWTAIGFGLLMRRVLAKSAGQNSQSSH